MKKTFLASIILICIGAFLGNYLKENSPNIKNVFNEGKTYYFLQEGVYSNEKAMKENTKELATKLVDNHNDKYYVYLGITRTEKNASKLKEMYKDKGYQVYIKEVNLNNEEFYNNVTQFDLLLENTKEENEILTIEEVILANYEELFKKE